MNVRVCEICEPASHASHRASHATHASHASHASHSANVKNFYLFYLHSREKILGEFFSLVFFFFVFVFVIILERILPIQNRLRCAKKNKNNTQKFIKVQDFREKKPEKNIRLHRYSNRYLLTHVIH